VSDAGESKPNLEEGVTPEEPVTEVRRIVDPSVEDDEPANATPRALLAGGSPPRDVWRERVFTGALALLATAALVVTIVLSLRASDSLFEAVEADLAARDRAVAEAEAARVAAAAADAGVAFDLDAGEGSAPDPDAATNDPALMPAENAEPTYDERLWRITRLAKDDGVLVIDDTLGNRRLYDALVASKVPRADVNKVIAAFKGIRKLDRLPGALKLRIALDKGDDHLVAIELLESPTEVWQAREHDDGAFRAEKLEFEREVRMLGVGILLERDLRASVVAAGLDDDLIKLVDEMLAGHVKAGTLKPGVQLRLVVEEERVEKKFGRYLAVHAIEVRPMGKGKPVRVYRFQPSKKVALGYYSQDGKMPHDGSWHSPIPLARISSRYNPRRMHPVLHVIMPHNGVDYAAPTGTPIYAVAAGTIRSVGDGGPCGNMVQIQHDRGLVSAYCHMSRFAPRLGAGQKVSARQLVGYVGRTGRATGPHLHFAMKRNDVFFDPLSLNFDGVRAVPKKFAGAFTQRRAELDPILDAIHLAGDAPAEEIEEKEEILDEAPGPDGGL
jgi:murein DD-endopeptidase MepM/ murein hydrolase activator NlpD